jgi:hypothetical protein
MKEYRLNKVFTVVCESEKTRYGFRHLARLLENGSQVNKTKACYYNRTWESYDFQSVIHAVINAHFDQRTAKRLCKAVDKKALGIASKRFQPVKAMVALGNLLGNTAEERAGFNKRIMSTIPGVDFPEGFDQLPAEERERRLTAAAEVL